MAPTADLAQDGFLDCTDMYRPAQTCTDMYRHRRLLKSAEWDLNKVTQRSYFPLNVSQHCAT